MILGRVVGTVVATHRADDLPGARYLVVQVTNVRGEGRPAYHVVLDILGAGPGELVVVSQGSSARQTSGSDQKPVDAIVAGIVDMVEEHGDVVFRK
jgi:microcompartment protein CcmK/EutM